MIQLLNIHSLSPLLVSVLFFFVAAFVLFKNKDSPMNRSFFFMGLSASLWQFSYSIVYNLKETSPVIIFWLKVAYVGVIFIAPTAYHFIVSFLNFNKKRLIHLFYSIFSLYACFALLSDSAIVGVRKFVWGYRPIVGEVYTGFIFLWIIPFALSFSYLYREYKRVTSPYNRKRIKYFLFTLPIAYLSAVDYLPNYGVNIYPFGCIPLLFFGISTAYAIVRYRLLDIEIIVKKGSLIAVGFVAAITFIYIGTFRLQPYLYILGARNWLFFPILISLLVGFGLFRFINFVRYLEEEELSKKFSYRPVLKKEAERMSKAHNTHELITYVMRDLSAWVRLDYVSIFVLDTQQKKFFMARSLIRTKKREKAASDAVLTYDGPLIIELLRSRKPLVYSEIEYRLRTKEALDREEEFFSHVAQQMRRLGAEITIPSFCEGELLAVINIGHKLNPNEIITKDDLDVFDSLANNIARALYGFMLKKEKTRLVVAAQNTIISAIEAKDSYTRGHTDRVARSTTLIGKRLEKILRNYPFGLHNLSWSAQLHDVGKIGIPDNILLKPGPLTEEEWLKIREHPLNGIKIITPVREWLGEDICAGILHHHENYDGSGYPAYQKGEEIHLFARIIRVADAFDAMTSDRPYRAALSKKDALEELHNYKEKYFDPFIVETLEEIYHSGEI